MLEAAIADGSALQRFREWIGAQGGDPRVADDVSLLPSAACSREVRAVDAGWVARFDTEGVGRAAMLLGAGRARVGDCIDPGAGLLLAVRVGDHVESGALLCTMCAASQVLLDTGEERFRRAVHLGESAATAPPLFHEL
jgi:pyrimidine-nucleoside phosphorylase